MSLSVLIAARNETWLRSTIDEVVTKRRGDTQAIVVCDGGWPVEPIPDHPDVHLVMLPESIGQRAAVNLAARLSDATYVMKLDAHCALAEGFDVDLMTAAGELGPDVTQIPRQYNLHVFDWQCDACQHRSYMGPVPTTCLQCKATGSFTMVPVWQPRWRHKTDFWRFDRTLHFQYWNAYKERPAAQGDIADVLSSLGACWFMRRDRFWHLGGLDEAHGSWGQMGTEIACKSWLSGGRQVVNKRTWFAHMFRTQQGFGFPYPNPTSAQTRAREYSQALWLQDRWPLATRTLAWLIDHFAPVPDWPASWRVVNGAVVDAEQVPA